MSSLARVTLLVRDYDQAIAFFRDALGFRLVEDRALDGAKRWVVMAPADSTGASLLLARAAEPEQTAQVGNQAGGRVAFFLETSDFEADYRHLKDRGIRFAEEPRHEPYGTVVVFLDLYGNKWDLVQRRH